MAWTGNGPRGPMGSLTGLIDGLQPLMTAIQARQEWRRTEAAKRKATAGKAQGSVRGNRPGSASAEAVTPDGNTPPPTPTAPTSPAPGNTSGERPDVTPNPGIPRGPRRGRRGRERDKPGYAVPLFKDPLGLEAGATRVASTIPSGTAPFARGAVGGGATDLYSSYARGGRGQLARAFGLPREGGAEPRLAGGRTPGAAPGGSEAERYASHLQAAGLPEAVVRQWTAKRYGA